MNTVLSSLFLPDDKLKIVKLASLYCDKIIIPSSYYMGLRTDELIDLDQIKPGDTINKVRASETYFSISDEIKKSIEVLVSESIAQIEEFKEDERDEQYTNMITFEDAFDDVAPRLVRNSGGNLGLEINPDLVKYLDEVQPKEMIRNYFAFLAQTAFIKSVQYNVPTLTDSNLVNEMLSHVIKTHKNDGINIAKIKSSFVAQRVLNEFVPNIGDSAIEDVLEVRYQLRNELEEFRASISKFSGRVRSDPWEMDVRHDVDKIIETDIRPNLQNLKLSIRRSNLQLVRRTFHNLKNARTYLPFVATVLGNVEPCIAALASVGLAGFEALLDTIQEKRKVREKSGLVFLLKAPERFAKIRRRR